MYTTIPILKEGKKLHEANNYKNENTKVRNDVLIHHFKDERKEEGSKDVLKIEERGY